MRRLSTLILTLAVVGLVCGGSTSFAKEIDDDMSIGATGGTVHVDPFTGTATTSIPIQVLPGRNGVQPNLQLTYASANGNGWVGMGWKLELGAIERNTKFGVIYNETPADNGKVYAVHMSGVSAELIKLNPAIASDPEYRAKVESGFFRIRTLATGGWEVTDRKGVKYSFGTTANGRVEDPNSSGRVFRWNLERVEDRDGNYLVATYIKDQGQSYLSQIDYTYSTKDTAPAPLSIRFYADAVAGLTAPDTYNAYFKVTTSKRLQAIEVKANGATMRAYKLSYTPSSTTGAYLLTQVQQFDRTAAIDPVTHNVTGAALPPVALSYSTSAATVTPSTADWLTGWCSGGTEINPSDVNGDGLQDLWCKNPGGGISGARANSDATFTNTGTGPAGCTTIGMGDFNGDGRSDAACYTLQIDAGYCASLPSSVRQFCTMSPPQVPVFRVALSNQDGMLEPDTVWLNAGTCVLPAQSQTPQLMLLGISDFNGDGRSDIWCMSTYFLAPIQTLGFALSTGSNSFVAGGSLTNFCSTNSAYSFGPGDFNGDGKADIWCHTGTGSTTLSYSTSTGASASFTAPTTPSTLTSWCAKTPAGIDRLQQGIPGLSLLINAGKFNVTDFNGDGLLDLWCHLEIGTVKVALSTGESFASPSVWQTGFCASATGGTASIADVNGDGTLDLWCHLPDGTTLVALSNGTTFSTPVAWGPAFCATGKFGNADLNGDGKQDLWCFNSGTLSVAIAGSPGVKPDLLNSVSNGLGASTALTYTPSTGLGVTHTLLPYPIYVTTTLAQTVSTAVGGTIGNQVAHTTYAYGKGYHSIANRDFRGFQRATVTACANCTPSEKTVTVTEFHQGSETTPTEDLGATLTHPDAPTKGLPYRILVQDQGLVPQLETLTTYANDADAVVPWYSPSAQVVTKTYAGGAIAKTTQTNFTYDHTYGNLVREEHQGDLGQAGDEKTIERVFANETTNWLLGFPTRETIYAGISTAVADKRAETTFFYDGTISCATASTLQSPTVGHLTRTVNWLNGGVNPEILMAYDGYGNRVCQRDPKGNQTIYTYDSTKTFARTVTNPLGQQTTEQYAGVDGQPLTNGLYGQALSVTDPNNKTTSSTYDALGRPLTTTTPDGLVTTKAYNYGGTFVVGTQHVQSTTSGGGLTVNLVSKTYFDGMGRAIKSEQAGAADGGGALKVLVTETQYDVRGLTKQTSLPYFQGTETATGRWRTMTYDALGRLTKTTNPDNTSSQVCYNGWTTTSLDPKLHKKVETKDAFGRLITVQEYTGMGSVTDCSGGVLYAMSTYSYDLLGNLLSLTDTKGNVSTMTYDSLGRKLTMHDPDMGNWAYTYDANGNLLTQVDAKNQKLCFSYDALNRRTQKNYGTTTVACGTNTVVYAYDDTVAANNGKGRLKQVTDPAQSVTFQYDSRGRITQSAKTLDGATYTTTSAYDGLGRLTSVSYPTNPIKTVTYTYDGPQLKSVQEGATTYVTYAGWNALGQPTTSTFGNGVVTTNTYANTNNATCTQQTFRLCTLKTLGPGGGGGSPTTYSASGDFSSTQGYRGWYYLDSTGASLTYDSVNGRWAGVDTYLYVWDTGVHPGNTRDTVRRWVAPQAGSAQVSGVAYDGHTSCGTDGVVVTIKKNGAVLWTRTIAAGDATGQSFNLSTTVVIGDQLDFVVNRGIDDSCDTTGFNPTIVVTPAGGGGGNTYTYDNNGNMTGGAGRTYTWNPENKPLTTVQGGTTTTFVYDGDGGRVKKIVGTTTTRYISKLYECDNANCSRFIWAGSTRIATIAVNTGTVNYWHGDHLGSSSVITDGTGSKVEAITYYPYGGTRTNQSPSTPAIDVPYKYTGKELDSTGLYYYEARYYDPQLGRFISADTVVPGASDPQAFNRFAYARNNPLLYTDPTGHWFGIDAVVIAIFVGATVGAVTSGIQSHWDPVATITGAGIGGLAAGLGVGVGGPLAEAIGGVTGGIAGGAVGGAVAGGASGALANAMGYNVNIGLAIASGAAAGGIVGGAGAQWGAGGAFLAATATGASAAAIRGADPGTGALFASISAAFSLGLQQVYSYSNSEAQAADGKAGQDLNIKPVADNPVIRTMAAGGPFFEQMAVRFLTSAVGQELTALLMAEAGYLNTSQNGLRTTFNFSIRGDFATANRFFDVFLENGGSLLRAEQTGLRVLHYGEEVTVNVRPFARDLNVPTLELFNRVQNQSFKFRFTE